MSTTLCRPSIENNFENAQGVFLFSVVLSFYSYFKTELSHERMETDAVWNSALLKQIKLGM